MKQSHVILLSLETNVCAYSSHSVIGLPEEEDWPSDVALPRHAFNPRPPQPIEKFVPDIDELGKDLILVSFCYSLSIT